MIILPLVRRLALTSTKPVPEGQWIFDGTDNEVFRHPKPARLAVNVDEAVRKGMGIGPLPVPVAQQGLHDGTLERVLPQYRLRTSNVFALYASRRYVDAKIKTFVGFLREAIPPAIAEQERELARLETTSCSRP